MYTHQGPWLVLEGIKLEGGDGALELSVRKRDITYMLEALICEFLDNLDGGWTGAGGSFLLVRLDPDELSNQCF